MPTKIETTWKKHMSVIKDIIFIIGILVSSIGWIRSEAIKETNTKNQIEILTKAVEDNTTQLEKINNVLNEQQNLNGQIIQYMKMK